MSTKTFPDWNQIIWREHRLEPAMDEIISDPIIQALMRRDGVTRADIRQLMDAARLRAGPRSPSHSPPGAVTAHLAIARLPSNSAETMRAMHNPEPSTAARKPYELAGKTELR